MTDIDDEEQAASEAVKVLDNLSKTPAGTIEIKLTDDQRLKIEIWANRIMAREYRLALGPASNIELKFEGRPTSREWDRLMEYLKLLRAAWVVETEEARTR